MAGPDRRHAGDKSASPAQEPAPLGTVDSTESPAIAAERARAQNAVGTVPSSRTVMEPALDGAFIGAGGKAYSPTTPHSQIPPILPSDGRKPRGLIIEVNGIMTTGALQLKDMQALADKTGAAVVGIHNSTAGLWMDLKECLNDKLDIGINPPVDTVAHAVYDAVKRGEHPVLVGHSQGALILSRALADVRNRLILEDGMSPAQAEELLWNVRVGTNGGAAKHYVDGPQYAHLVNLLDAVPMATGAGLNAADPLGRPAKGARVRYITEAHLPNNMPPLSDGVSNFLARAVDRTVHGPQDVYWDDFARWVDELGWLDERTAVGGDR